jgi:hypothetical protein
MHTSDIDLQRFADFQPTAFDHRGVGSDGQEDWLVLPISQTRDSGLLEQSNFDAAEDSLRRVQARCDKARRRILHKLNRRNVETPFLGVSVREFAKEMCDMFADFDDNSEAERRLLETVGLPPVDGETIAGFAERLESLSLCSDFETHRFGHWGPGWFEIIVVRPGSACHREAQAIVAAVSDYPVLDESDYSRREYESQCEAISESLRSLTIEDDGADVGDWDLFHQAVFSDLWDNDQQALESSDEGCWISRETISASLERLGFVYCEDDMTWRPEGETEDHSDCEDCSECGATPDPEETDE